ncbi:hypothetical protein BC940DRAFT_309382 [Gongronella butleri]|nr:hypothetical protein BC940DRAFT_309382 [Gongronella butleri]
MVGVVTEMAGDTMRIFWLFWAVLAFEGCALSVDAMDGCGRNCCACACCSACVCGCKSCHGASSDIIFCFALDKYVLTTPDSVFAPPLLLFTISSEAARSPMASSVTDVHMDDVDDNGRKRCAFPLVALIMLLR